MIIIGIIWYQIKNKQGFHLIFVFVKTKTCMSPPSLLLPGS